MSEEKPGQYLTIRQDKNPGAFGKWSIPGLEQSFEFDGCNRLFAVVHEQEAELFYILAGTGVYSDDGTGTDVRAGDAAICETGHGHSITNTGEDTLEFVAVIVYA